MTFDNSDESTVIRRAHVFARILICLGLLVALIYGIIAQAIDTKVAAAAFGVTLCLSGGSLLALHDRNKIYQTVRIIIIINVLILSSVELITGTTAGITWLGYLIWPSLVLLVLRDNHAYLATVAFCGMLLFIVPLLTILQVLPIIATIDQGSLWLFWAVLIVVYTSINLMIYFIWRDEQQAQSLTERTIQELNKAYSELQEQNTVISEALERQHILQSQVAELQVPLIRLGNQAALLPLIGTLDSKRIKEVFTHVPQELHTRGVKWLILDLTGGAFIDPNDLLLINDLVQTIRLIGIRTSVTGISPELAREIAARPGLPLQKLSQRLEDVLLPVQASW